MRSLSACASRRVRPISTERSRRLSICSSRRERSAAVEVLETVEAEQRVLERGCERRVGERSGSLEVAHVQQHQRPARRGRDDRGCVRPAHDERQVRLGLKRPGDLRDRLVAPGDSRPERDAPQRDRRAGLEQPVPAPRMNAARRSASLTGRSASGTAESGSSSRTAPTATSRASGAKHASTSCWLDAVAGQQARDQARAGEAPRDVVLQVGIQAAIAGMKLGRRAHRQHRGVERVEAEPIGRRSPAQGPRPGPRGLPRASAPGHRRCTARGARRPGCRRRRRRRAPPTAPGRRGTRTSRPASSRSDVTCNCLSLALQRLARAGKQSADRCAARPAAARRESPRARSVGRRRGCRGCTHPNRSRCRCRP